jgi:predicted glycosyltransferase
MGGYNTVCEILSFEKPALIVPRVKPRREQLIRAERLQALGLVDVLHPDHLTPGALSAWLVREPRPVERARDRIRLDGLPHLPRLLGEVLGDRSFRRDTPSTKPAVATDIW